ncbi:MAG: hypothetical protein U0228_39460 [Myxococcaceae bacterium]
MTDLVPDCARCAALCCRLTSFARSEDFAFTRHAGEACRHLAGHRCAVHAERIERGLQGCTVYSCFGAGQALTLRLGGVAPSVAIRAFGALVRVHEALFVLDVLAARFPAHPSIEAMTREVRARASLSPAELAELRDDDHRGLRALVTELARAPADQGAGR